MLTHEQAYNKLKYLTGRVRYLAKLADAIAKPALKLPGGHPDKKRIRLILEEIKKAVDECTDQANLYAAWLDEGDLKKLAERYK